MLDPRTKHESIAECVAKATEANYAKQAEAPRRRAGLREQLEKRLAQYEQEQEQNAYLHELRFLLEKHPDVARMLDLMELAGMRQSW